MKDVQKKLQELIDALKSVLDDSPEETYKNRIQLMAEAQEESFFKQLNEKRLGCDDEEEVDFLHHFMTAFLSNSFFRILKTEYKRGKLTEDFDVQLMKTFRETFDKIKKSKKSEDSDG